MPEGFCSRVLAVSRQPRWCECSAVWGCRPRSTRPALVPLVGGFDWTHALSGITLADCQATVQQLDRGGSKPEKKKRPLLVRRGSWLFTHFGFSGPAAMDLSGALTAAASFQDVALTLDFLPDLDRVALETAFSDRRGVSGRRKIAA